MDSGEFWTLLYEKRLNNDKLSLSTEQTHLFFYIDFVYFVENGGASGFVYNMTPTKIGDNYYQPYIDSFIFFGFVELAKLLDKYNENYNKALEIYANDKSQDFRSVLITLNSFELYEKIDNAVDAQDKILNWIDLNMSKLKIGFLHDNN